MEATTDYIDPEFAKEMAEKRAQKEANIAAGRMKAAATRAAKQANHRRACG